MTKKLKPSEQGAHITSNIIDSAREIWLAGVGAFAKAEEEGNKFFENLVKEGEKIEARGRKVAEEAMAGMKGTMTDVRNKANDTWDKIEQVFQDRVARALNALGVPTYEDIQDLSQRVEVLTETVRELTRKSGANKSGQ